MVWICLGSFANKFVTQLLYALISSHSRRVNVCRERQAANGLLDAESGESRHGLETSFIWFTLQGTGVKGCR